MTQAQVLVPPSLGRLVGGAPTCDFSAISTRTLHILLLLPPPRPPTSRTPLDIPQLSTEITDDGLRFKHCSVDQ
jgi:hypothetical protein